MIIVVMGVTGCGKTSVGSGLARRLGCAFIEGDAHHLPASREKLRNNVPLGDEDRWPWLRALAAMLRSAGAGGADVVLSCSALKQSYRDVLAQCGHPVTFVHLVGTADCIADRLNRRAGSHELVGDFDRILAAQFRDLEPPTDAITVAIDQPADLIVEQVLAALSKQSKV